MSLLVAFALASAASTSGSASAEGGTLLVLNKTDSTLSFLDAANGQTLAVVGTGVGPHEIAVAPSQKLAAVADYGREKSGHQLTLVDLEHRLPVDAIDLGAYHRPHGITFAGDSRVFVTCEENQCLVEVDVAARKVARTIPTDQQLSHMVVITPNAQRAFVANINSNSVSVLDLALGKFVMKIDTGNGSEGVDLSPDGREVWVCNRAADSLAVVDAEKFSVLTTIPCAKFPIRVKFTPDGKRALVSNAESGEVAVFDTATRKELKRIPMGVRAGNDVDARLFSKQFGDSPAPVGVLIAPDGKRAFIANTNADVITVLDLERLEIADRYKAGREPDGLAYVGR